MVKHTTWFLVAIALIPAICGVVGGIIIHNQPQVGYINPYPSFAWIFAIVGIVASLLMLLGMGLQRYFDKKGE